MEERRGKNLLWPPEFFSQGGNACYVKHYKNHGASEKVFICTIFFTYIISLQIVKIHWFNYTAALEHSVPIIIQGWKVDIKNLFYYFWVVFVEVVIQNCISCLDWQCSVRPFKHLAAETSLKMLFCRLVVLHLPSEHTMTYNQLASRLNPCFWCSSSNLLLSLERAI